MKAVIGIDSATPVVAVASTRAGELIREAADAPSDDERPRHSELLLGEVEGCVEAAGGWEEVGLISVGLGPGSYTGLRIGIASARALAQARGLPIVGVGTLAALARGMAEFPEAGGWPTLPLLDARRGQLAAALYREDGEELWAPHLTSADELAGRVRELDPPPLAAGDGSLRFIDELVAGGVRVAPPEDQVHRIAARHICAIGEASGASPAEQIEPLYLRAPDAEKWLQRDETEFP